MTEFKVSDLNCFQVNDRYYCLIPDDSTMSEVVLVTFARVNQHDFDSIVLISLCYSCEHALGFQHTPYDKIFYKVAHKLGKQLNAMSIAIKTAYISKAGTDAKFTFTVLDNKGNSMTINIFKTLGDNDLECGRYNTYYYIIPGSDCLHETRCIFVEFDNEV